MAIRALLYGAYRRSRSQPVITIWRSCYFIHVYSFKMPFWYESRVYSNLVCKNVLVLFFLYLHVVSFVIITTQIIVSI